MQKSKANATDVILDMIADMETQFQKQCSTDDTKQSQLSLMAQWIKKTCPETQETKQVVAGIQCRDTLVKTIQDRLAGKHSKICVFTDGQFIAQRSLQDVDKCIQRPDLKLTVKNSEERQWSDKKRLVMIPLGGGRCKRRDADCVILYCEAEKVSQDFKDNVLTPLQLVGKCELVNLTW